MGVSIVVDFSLNTWLFGMKFVRSHGIPYIKVERQMKPFLQVFGDYLQEKLANDVVLILQNNYLMAETFYELVEGFPFRVLLLNGKNRQDTVKRIKNLRPLPSYYGIFANGEQMNYIFEEVCHLIYLHIFIYLSVERYFLTTTGSHLICFSIDIEWRCI